MHAKQNKGIAPIKNSSHRSDQDNNNKGLNGMINWLIALVMVLPFLYSNKTIDPVLSIRYISLGWFVLFFSLFFYVIKRTPVLIPSNKLTKSVFLLAIGFVLWSVLCLFFSINHSESLYEVLRYLLNTALLFLVVAAVKKEPLLIFNLCKAMVIVALIHSFVGILQYFKLAFTDIPGSGAANPNDPGAPLPHGLMANRNLFGSAQALLLPFVLLAIYKSGKIWRLAGIVSLVAALISIAMSQTRSAWLSVISMTATITFLVVFFLPAIPKIWITYALGIFVCAALILSVILASSPASSLTKSIKTRALSLINPSLEDPKSSGRITLWKKSIQLIKDHPITGVGPGNWKLAIPLYGEEDSAWATDLVLPSHPHNVYIEVTSETGILGAVLYFGVWVMIGIAAYKVVQHAPLLEDRIVTTIMLGGLVAFATDSMFSFPTQRLEHLLYFVLMAGIILGYYTKFSEVGNAEQKVRKPLLFIMAAVCIAVFNVLMAYKKHSFEKHAKEVKIARLERRYADVIEEVEKGKNGWVTLDPAGEPLEMQSSAVYAELKVYDKAMIEIIKAKNYHPNSARIYTTMGVIYANQRDYNMAIKSYQHALRLAPGYSVALNNVAGLYFITGNYAGCVQAIEKNENKGFLNTPFYIEAKKRLKFNAK